MSTEYLRLAEKPGLLHPGYPICDACYVETSLEDCSWLCPSCGTAWSAENLEAEPEDATLFPEWSGEELTGLVCPNDLASRVHSADPEERERILARLLDTIKEGGAA